MVGGRIWPRSANMQIAASIAPAAERVCPSIDLVDEIGGQTSPNTWCMAIASIRSFSGVDVPLSHEYPDALVDEPTVDLHGLPLSARKRRDLLLRHTFRFGIGSARLGGAQADAIDDRASRLAPLSPASATTMLTETRLTAALDNAGFDSSALVDAIVAAAQLASDHPEIAELDLNPVIVSDAGAVVTDAVIRLVPHVVDDSPLRRLD